MDNAINVIFPDARRENDIYMIGNARDISTKFSEEAQNGLFGLEDNSWWFRYRANVIHDIFKKYLDADKLTVDVGGGNGYTTNYLAKKGFSTALLEPSFSACANARKRGLKNVVCGTLSEEDVKEKSIPQIMLLDVLEHIEDDVGFLRLAHKKLADGGRVLLTVPAMKVLWSSEDDEAGHFRRYDRKTLEIVVKKAGFKVEYINYFFEFAFLPILLIRVFLEKIGLLKKTGSRSENEKEKTAQQQFKERGGIVGKVLNLFEGIELKRLNGVKKIKFGSSLICVIKKD